MLSARLERLGTKVEFGTELLGFRQDNDGVTAELVTRQDDKEVHESVDCDFLVGADGAKGNSSLCTKFLDSSRIYHLQELFANRSG